MFLLPLVHHIRIDVLDRIARFLVVVVDEAGYEKDIPSLFPAIKDNAGVVEKTVRRCAYGRIRTRLISFQRRKQSLTRGVLGITRQQRARPGVASIE